MNREYMKIGIQLAFFDNSKSTMVDIFYRKAVNRTTKWGQISNETHLFKLKKI